MAKNMFVRAVDLDAIKSVQLCDYSEEQLVAFLITNYPNDPIGALNTMITNLEVGSVLSGRVRVMLEAMRNVKR